MILKTANDQNKKFKKLGVKEKIIVKEL